MSLMELIFNQDYFQATMAALNYDSEKLPLGKLSKNTITRGWEALKELSDLLDDSSLASNYNMSFAEAIESLSNRFYSFIPHAFGRNRPPVINNNEMLKKEIELLESLTDLKDADLIMKKERSDDEMHVLDSRFKSLGLQEMTPIKRSSEEFKEISQYLLKTCGATHAVSYQIDDVFRIERNGEEDRFVKSEYASIESDRRLLWHGSRATNFGGILGQGLRIAPPEAPVNGYMFGKGIYLADMSSKSANYCASYNTGGNALLLLCDAELGNPMQVLQDADYNAGENAKARGLHSTWGQGLVGPSQWKDAKCIHPSLAGVKMVCVLYPFNILPR
jgi:poly [ADP-ribose] polymerase 2/3/4